MRLLLSEKPESEVVCLCRATDNLEAEQRVRQSFEKQHIAIPPGSEHRLSCYASIFSKDRLGLSEEIFDGLARRQLIVIHAAWPVHFGAGLNSFISHLEGKIGYGNPSMFADSTSFRLAESHSIDSCSSSNSALLLLVDSSCSRSRCTSASA